ncbi:glycine betaine/proline transport system permease protein [Nocardioides cavernae]|uniref:Glycine betaine/proline transport system permease protein n=1 Tax=Nocardioides cavernae TaxID=1921566 RepID=A0A7Y9KRX1_9ACTN|nr:ABC transporter permease subunit [Nocardioides cavernae]NYE37015.1 glycine betaine/proline transport system permease protein [Nocardioides cavernae]
MTATAPAPPRRVEPDAAPPVVEDSGISRWVPAAAVVVLWVVVWAFTRGTDTLDLPSLSRTDLHDRLTEIQNGLLEGRSTNPVMQFTNAIADAFRGTVDWLQRLLSKPAFPRPVPEIGWLGVTALATYVGLVVASWRIAVLVLASFLSFGVLGYWDQSMDTLIIVLISVLLAVVIGMPLAVWIGTNARANAVVTVFLDLMQTMPTFVYLLPIVLFFGIGTSAAVVATLIYALPPIIRIAGFGIREVPATTIEATDSAGQTYWQRLLKVQLPMARKTIIVGLNQTTLAALSMATLASFVDGPGLGKPVLQGLRVNDVGTAFVPGALIVVMAVMLDRTTTAASERSERVARGGGHRNPRLRRVVVAGGAVVALVAVYLSRTYVSLAEFPTYSIGRTISSGVSDVVDAIKDTFGGVTGGLKDGVTEGLLNPVQSVLADSPWYVSFVAIAALALVFGGVRALVITVVCLLGVLWLDLWNDAMVTLNMTLVATVLVMALALVFGVWMARDRRVDLGIRPLLDAGQTIPPFVYLIPVLALFGPGRFTAIVAGIVYAAPAAIKLVADGVKGVSPTTIEAGRSTGQTTWQEITKVQLPMAKGSLVLATNQGLLYVLSMTVIGGLVGAGALGFDVVYGFSRSEAWGKGAAAGLTIVLIGVMLDRITRAASDVRRDDGPGTRRAFSLRLPIGPPGN